MVMSNSHTYTILDGAGYRLASVTLYNMGRIAAADEARKVAKSLSPDSWGISYEGTKAADATKEQISFERR